MSDTSAVRKSVGSEDYGRGDSNLALVNRMGSKRGYNPIPPAQHEWQKSSKVSLGVHQLWSWMCDHTIALGRRSEFAITKDNSQAHIENAAADLKMDEANARKYWREGLMLGIWRNGTAKEGRRRMYLLGELIPQAVSPLGKRGKKVCTDLLPPYILKKINKLEPERQREFWSKFERHTEVRNAVTAELVAAARMVLDEDEDNLLREFGVEKNRQEHKKKQQVPADVQARAERIAMIRQHVERYVHTLKEASVQTSTESVQPNSADASLLPSERTKNTERRAGDSSVPSGGNAARSPHIAALAQGLGERGYFPDDHLLAELEKLREDMPLEFFFIVVDKRRRKGHFENGLLKALMEDALRRWRFAASQQQATEPKESPRERERNIQAAWSTYREDPDERMRQLAREVLIDYGVWTEEAGGGA